MQTRFHFLVRTDSDAQVQELDGRDVDRDWPLFSQGEHSWSLQTYLRLRQAGCPVTCSRDLVADRINIGHAATLGQLEPRRNAFVVSLQADFPRVPWAHLHVVQNQAQAKPPHSYWIPHWPQPGLVARSPSRTSVSCVAHAGRLWMLTGEPEEWNEDLARIGCHFVHLDPNRWNDLSGVDVLLAIRSFNPRTYKTKPPTKLLNAWIAGIPLVAGNDCAFSQLGTPGTDYLLVASLEEALAAIRKLKDDPAFYRSIVDHGRERAADFTRERMISRWTDFLNNVAAERYHRWLAGERESGFVWGCRILHTRLARGIRGTIRRTAQQLAGTEVVDQLRLRFR